MPFTSNYLYTRILGTLGNNGTGVEQWGVGFKVPVPSGTLTAGQIEAYLSTISGAITTFHQGQVSAGTSTFLKQLTGAMIGTDGKYLGGGTQSTQVYNYATPPAGVTAGTQPFSSCIVLSLRTPQQRGYASNGRLYWPSQGTAVGATTGTFNSSSMGTVASQAATMINQINAALGTVLGLGGSSRVAVMSSVGAGTTALVTSVRVGVKPDRQERREKRIREDHVSAAVASTAGLLEELRDRPIG